MKSRKIAKSYSLAKQDYILRDEAGSSGKGWLHGSCQDLRFYPIGRGY
jgi:hypothetical protein